MIILTRQEELSLLTIFRLKDPAYLVNIRDHLLEHTGKDWAFGSLYISLEKLIKKGYLEAHVGEPSATRGGKAIKYYRITQEGTSVLVDSKRLNDLMWREFSVAMKRGDVANEK